MWNLWKRHFNVKQIQAYEELQGSDWAKSSDLCLWWLQVKNTILINIMILKNSKVWLREGVKKIWNFPDSVWPTQPPPKMAKIWKKNKKIIVLKLFLDMMLGDGWCKYLNGEMRKVNHLSRPYLFLVSLILTIILTKFAKLKDVILNPPVEGLV